MVQDDFRDKLDSLVNAQIVNHMLEVPVSDSKEETVLLGEINMIIAAPLIRVASGHYAFLMEPAEGPQICQALEHLNGTLRGLGPVQAVEDVLNGVQREIIRTLLDAALLEIPKNILDAGFLINAAKLGAEEIPKPVPSDDATSPTSDHSAQLNKIEQHLDDLDVQPTLDKITERLDCIEKTIAGDEFIGPRFVPQSELENFQDKRLEQLKQQIEKLDGLRASVELLDTQMNKFQSENSAQPLSNRFEEILQGGLVAFGEKIDSVREGFEVSQDRLHQDLVSVSSQVEHLADTPSGEDYSEAFAVSHSLLTELKEKLPEVGFEQRIETQIRELLTLLQVAEKGERMKLIADGERLSRITKGLQKVLERMSGPAEGADISDASEHADNLDVEACKDMEMLLHEQLAQLHGSDVAQMISDNLPGIARLLVENNRMDVDTTSDFSAEADNAPEEVTESVDPVAEPIDQDEEQALEEAISKDDAQHDPSPSDETHLVNRTSPDQENTAQGDTFGPEMEPETIKTEIDDKTIPQETLVVSEDEENSGAVKVAS